MWPLIAPYFSPTAGGMQSQAAPYFSPTAGTRPVVFHSQAALYLRLPTGGWFGPKPSLGSSFPLVTGNRTDGNGSASDTAMRTRAFPFKMRGWSSGAPGDANATHAAVFILPTGTQIPLVTGATQLPAALASMAIASAVCERGGGYVGEASGGTALSAASTINAHAIAAESAAIQTWLEAAGRGAHRTEPAAGTGDSTTMSGAAFAGEFEYPPGPPGPKTAAAGGFISFAGYRWIVKDTGGEHARVYRRPRSARCTQSLAALSPGLTCRRFLQPRAQSVVERSAGRLDG